MSAALTWLAQWLGWFALLWIIAALLASVWMGYLVASERYERRQQAKRAPEPEPDYMRVVREAEEKYGLWAEAVIAQKELARELRRNQREERSQ